MSHPFFARKRRFAQCFDSGVGQNVQSKTQNDGKNNKNGFFQGVFNKIFAVFLDFWAFKVKFEHPEFAGKNQKTLDFFESGFYNANTKMPFYPGIKNFRRNKNMKKLLAIVLAVACCLSCLAFVVSADAADILADAPVNYTPWIDFTEWTETELAPFAVNKETEVVVPSIDENGLMTLTMTNNLGYVGYYAPGTNVAVKDDETGEITGAYPGTVLSLNEGSAFTDSTDATSGVCFWIDLSGMNGVHENGDGTMNLYFYFNDLDFNEDGTVNKKAGKEVSTSWKGTAVVPVNYVGWVKIPFADMVAEWDTPDNNGKIDMNTVDWFMIYPNNPTDGGVYKIGHVGFYGDAMFALDENVVVGTEMPEDWTLIVDGSEIENDDYNSGLFTADPETQGTIEAVDTGLKVTVPSTCTCMTDMSGV